MKKIKRFTLLSMIVFSLVFINLGAADVNKTFKAVDNVKIKTVSGDCIVKIGGSSEIKVHVNYTYPADKFKPVFKEEDGVLLMKEDFKKGSKDLKGESKWTVTVPAKTNIAFKSASGNLDVGELQGKLNAKTASGNVTAAGANGTINVKSASGHIAVGGTGTFNIKCANGDIKAKGIVLEGASGFNSVSGKINVVLAKSSKYDISLKTVSGDATLDYNGNDVKGYFVFKGQKGNIHSDIPFEGGKDKGYSPFVKKSFKKGGDSPKVSFSTVSGSLTLKK